MPVPTYLDIPDSDIDPESPINYSLLARLRDNILSVIGGGSGAPAMRPSLLGLYGSSADGVLLNSWAPTNPGFYDFESDEPSILSSGRTLPWFTFLRVSGDLNISAAQTADATPTSPEMLALLGVMAGEDGVSGTGVGNGGGGANHGAGGDGSNAGAGTDGAGGSGRDYSTLYRWWLSKNLGSGGAGGDSGVPGTGLSAGGGVIVLMVEGDLDLTGGTLSVPGTAGQLVTSGGDVGASGGGAAGTIIVICTGTLTGGTFLAVGGAGGNDSAGGGGGGGGGGAVALIASAFAGSQTITVTGGSGPGSATNGSAGHSETVTLTAEFIRGLFWR